MPAKSAAKTVQEYLRALDPERREILGAVRKVILENLPAGYEEVMQYGMISYAVPHRIYPAGYHCDPSQPLPYCLLGSQKNHMSLYSMGVYGDPATEKWLREAYAAAGKKIDMGKACIRFKTLDALPLKVIGDLIARVPVKKYIERVQQTLAQRKTPARTRTAAKTARTKSAAA